MSFNEWDEVPLNDLCEYISRGVTPAYTDQNGVVVLNQKCIRDNRVSYEQSRLTNPDKKKITEDKFLRSYDILINSTGVGTLGRVAQIKEIVDKTTVDSHITIVRANKSVNPRFLGYNIFLQQPNIEALAEGSTGQTELSRTRLSEVIKILLPSDLEQKAIANTLSCLDDKIELNNRISKTLEEIAQSIFKSWFVDFEPFQGGEFKDSELGRIPNGWRVSKLNKICKTITKGTTPTTLKRKFVDSGINFIKAESINDNHSFDINKFAYIDEETNDLLKRSKIQENDILLTIAGTIGRYVMATGGILPANTNQAIGIIRVDEKVINPIYILNLFMCDCHKEFLESKVVQAVQANLSLGVIGDLPVVIPTYEILKKYYEIAFPMFDKKKNLFNETRALKIIRDSLLPKLMSGEIRVPLEEM